MYSVYLIVLLLCQSLLHTGTWLSFFLYPALMFHWYYASHQVLHHFPTINLHTLFHHDHLVKLDRNVELFIDFLAELAYLIGIPLIFQWFFQIQIVPTPIIIFISLAFALNHILNYSFLPSDKHRAHHLNDRVNFYPDFMDHLYSTNSDAEYEDMTQHIPSLVQSCIIVHFVIMPYMALDTA